MLDPISGSSFQGVRDMKNLISEGSSWSEGEKAGAGPAHCSLISHCSYHVSLTHSYFRARHQQQAPLMPLADCFSNLLQAQKSGKDV